MPLTLHASQLGEPGEGRCTVESEGHIRMQVLVLKGLGVAKAEIPAK